MVKYNPENNSKRTTAAILYILKSIRICHQDFLVVLRDAHSADPSFMMEQQLFVPPFFKEKSRGFASHQTYIALLSANCVSK